MKQKLRVIFALVVGSIVLLSLNQVSHPDEIAKLILDAARGKR